MRVFNAINGRIFFVYDEGIGKVFVVGFQVVSGELNHFLFSHFIGECEDNFSYCVVSFSSFSFSYLLFKIHLFIANGLPVIGFVFSPFGHVS